MVVEEEVVVEEEGQRSSSLMLCCRLPWHTGDTQTDTGRSSNRESVLFLRGKHPSDRGTL